MSSSSYFSVILTSVILILVCLLPSLCDHDSMGAFIGIGCIIGFVIFLVIVGLYNYPLSVTLDSENFYINYLIHRRKINLSNIASVSQFVGEKRLFPILGSYGFIGWWGIYYNSKIGKVKLTASNICELITLVLTNGKVLVISCNDAEDLAKQINRHLAI